MQLIGIEGRMKTDGDHLKTKGDNGQVSPLHIKPLKVMLVEDHLSPQTQNQLKVARGKVAKHKRLLKLIEPLKNFFVNMLNINRR